MRTIYAGFALALLLATGCENEKPPKGPASDGAFSVKKLSFDDLEDTRRGREVPATVYYPDTAGSFPAIVLSHGLGGDRSHYTYLARHLAGHGYVVIVPEHVGSSSRLNAAQLVAALYSENEARDRAADISFTLDMAEVWNSDNATLAGRFELANIGVTGHSYGGATAHFMGGALVDFDDHYEDLRDGRVKAVVPMAAGDVDGGSPWFDSTSFDHYTTPCLQITGMNDGWLSKKASHDDMPGGNKYFTALANVGHLDFTNAPNDWGAKARANIVICGLVTAFFNKYLKGNGKHLTESFADDLCDWQVPYVIWYEK